MKLMDILILIVTPVPREIAQKTSYSWNTPLIGDRSFLSVLKSLGLIGQTSGKYTVKYRADFNKLIAVRRTSSIILVR